MKYFDERFLHYAGIVERKIMGISPGPQVGRNSEFVLMIFFFEPRKEI